MNAEKTVIRCVGVAETHLKNLILTAKQIDKGACEYKSERKYDENILQIIYDENIPKRLLDDVIRVFAEGLKDCIYALA